MAVQHALQAVVDAAVTSTGAASGWILCARESELEVVAEHGAASIRGRRVSVDDGAAGFAFASGQPMAVAIPSADDRLHDGVHRWLPTVPTTVMSIPCTHLDQSVGVLQVVDKAGGAPFTFEDVELAAVLADVAGAALHGDAGAPAPPSPELLADGLRRVAQQEPASYPLLADIVQRLLASA